MAKTTSEQYQRVVDQCKEVFSKKLGDYGTSWRALRPPSITDQIFIKAKRIRNLQANKERKVDEGVEPEFKAIVNYGIIALIQLSLGNKKLNKNGTDLSTQKSEELYDKMAQETKSLMEAKNHDYGEAWRDMRVSSLVDLILMRIYRIKKIEENQGKTAVSEGVESNYYDIVNYAIFALIKLKESNEGAARS
jgi:hypothetical protein